MWNRSQHLEMVDIMDVLKRAFQQSKPVWPPPSILHSCCNQFPFLVMLEWEGVMDWWPLLVASFLFLCFHARLTRMMSRVVSLVELCDCVFHSGLGVHVLKLFTWTPHPCSSFVQLTPLVFVGGLLAFVVSLKSAPPLLGPTTVVNFLMDWKRSLYLSFDPIWKLVKNG